MPARIPITGLEKAVSRLANSGISFKGLTAALIVFIPNIKMENPNKMPPVDFFRSDLPDINRMTPVIARTGEKVSGFNSIKKKLSLSSPERLRSQEVMVVPILAPMMMPTACSSRISPELTKPTTMTVVAEEDCMRAVVPAPSSTPFMGLSVILVRMASILPPEVFARPSPRRYMPYRKRARPPVMVNKFDRFI